MKLTTIPFSGTYNTYFDPWEHCPTDGQGSHVDDGNVPFGAYIDYLGKVYTEAMNRHIKDLGVMNICLEFDGTSSPREYNFETDRIFANVSEGDVEKLRIYAHENKAEFQQYLNRHHKSRDGFSSWYPYQLDEWMAFTTDELDHNHVGSYLGFFIENSYDDDYGDLSFEMYEAVQEDLSNWCYGHYEYEHEALYTQIADKIGNMNCRENPDIEVEWEIDGEIVTWEVSTHYGDITDAYAEAVRDINNGFDTSEVA